MSVSVQGSGLDSIYVAIGSKFNANSPVSIRVTRIERGTIHDVRFNTSSDSQGRISAQLPIPCVSGLVFNFSSTDGRSNPADLTGFLWSSPVSVTCP